MLVFQFLRRFVGGLLVLFLLLTVVAVVMTIRGTLPWTTLGEWFLLDMATLVIRRLVFAVERWSAPRPGPRVPAARQD